MKTTVKITPKEITTSKGSGTVKEKEPYGQMKRKRQIRRDTKGGSRKRKGDRRNGGEGGGQTYADKHVQLLARHPEDCICRKICPQETILTASCFCSYLCPSHAFAPRPFALPVGPRCFASRKGSTLMNCVCLQHNAQYPTKCFSSAILSQPSTGVELSPVRILRGNSPVIKRI